MFIGNQASCWAGLFKSLICLTKYVFSSLNCSSSVLSFWNLLRNSMSLAWFLRRMSRMGCVLLGLATNTCTGRDQRQLQDRAPRRLCRQQSTCGHAHCSPGARAEVRITHSGVSALEDLIFTIKKGGKKCMCEHKKDWHVYSCSETLKWSHSVVSDSLRPPWTVAYKAPLSMEFSRQEYWSGLPFPSPRDLPNPGIEPGSPALQADTSVFWATREAWNCSWY